PPRPSSDRPPGDPLPPPARNPSSSVAMTPPAAVPVAAVTPQSDMAKSTSVVPLPDHNPQTPPLLAPPPSAAPAPSASPPPQVVTDMPPPDANPNRTAALPFAMK